MVYHCGNLLGVWSPGLISMVCFALFGSFDAVMPPAVGRTAIFSFLGSICYEASSSTTSGV